LPASVHAYRFNRDTFAFECFDDEIVVLNVIDGVYYAFRGAAVPAWPYIIAQHPEPVIASTLATRYGIQADAVTVDLTEFIERLASEKILLTASENTSGIDYSQSASLTKYAGFIFERHDDMDDLLTLDPIHDVDAQKGWPNT
jgi:hypothetical protein